MIGQRALVSSHDPLFHKDEPMAHNNQNLVLDSTETAQFLELQAELNKDGTRRSLSQVVAYALRVALANAKAAPNADFRDKGELFSDPFERTI